MAASERKGNTDFSSSSTAVIDLSSCSYIFSASSLLLANLTLTIRSRTFSFILPLVWDLLLLPQRLLSLFVIHPKNSKIFRMFNHALFFGFSKLRTEAISESFLCNDNPIAGIFKMPIQFRLGFPQIVQHSIVMKTIFLLSVLKRLKNGKQIRFMPCFFEFFKGFKAGF